MITHVCKLHSQGFDKSSCGQALVETVKQSLTKSKRDVSEPGQMSFCQTPDYVICRRVSARAHFIIFVSEPLWKFHLCEQFTNYLAKISRKIQLGALMNTVNKSNKLLSYIPEAFNV